MITYYKKINNKKHNLLKLQHHLNLIKDTLDTYFINSYLSMPSAEVVEQFFSKKYRNKLRKLVTGLHIKVIGRKGILWTLLENPCILVQLLFYTKLFSKTIKVDWRKQLLQIISSIPLNSWIMPLYKKQYFSLLFNKVLFIFFDNLYTTEIIIKPKIIHKKYRTLICEIQKSHINWIDNLMFVNYIENMLLKYYQVIHRMRLSVVMPTSTEGYERPFILAGVFFQKHEKVDHIKATQIIRKSLVKIYRDLTSIHTEEYYSNIEDMYYMIHLELVDDIYFDKFHFENFHSIAFKYWGINENKTLEDDEFDYDIE